MCVVCGQQESADTAKQNLEHLLNQIFPWESEKKCHWEFLRGIDCRGLILICMVSYHRKKQTNHPQKSSFSPITFVIFTQIKIGDQVSLGNSTSCPNPVSELCSDKKARQEKANKYFCFFLRI